ncbi:MAG: hypothetical protein ABIJ97_13145 [Bacteroidota bacterium]
MTKENILSFCLISALTIAFIAVSATLFFSKNKKFLKYKFKIGAVIIGLTSIATTQQSCVTCYDPVDDYPNTMKLDTEFQDSLLLYINKTNFVTGGINNRQGSNFSYSISDSSIIYQSGQIYAKDGDFDESNEDFEIAVSNSIQDGNYNLKLFAGRSDGDNYQALYRLKVTRK